MIESAISRKSNPNKLKALQLARRAWIKTIINTLIFVCTSAGVVFGGVQYKHHFDKRHDLSVIGNGIPTVVQVHDPSCRLCQQLRSNLLAATSALDDQALQVRIADIGSVTGANFASSHQVPHVTLLFFDARGNLVENLQGVKSEEEIERSVKSLLALRR
jgi:hypothetical protein